MIVEMRTYQLKVGSVATVEERFAKGLPGRVKLSRLAALWHSEVGALNQIVHLWPYESAAEREQVRAAAAKIEGWPPNILEFVLEMTSEVLIPAPFSPPLKDGAYGPLYEIRRYIYQPGSIPHVIKRWEAKIEGRTRLSPLVGAWYSDVGPLNRWIHIWAYKDFADRERIRNEAIKQGLWPPLTSEWLIKQENSLVLPASFSALR